MKIIMRDIARLAQVSPGTVSNALNNRKGVGKETKEKIIKIAEELGYFKTQKKNEKKVIRMIKYKKHGYVVADTPFFSTLIEACENECRANGYELLISQVIHGQHTNEDIYNIINENEISGVILLATEMDQEDFDVFENISIPIIIIDNYFIEKNFDFVLINNIKGAYLAVNHLVEKGYSEIGMIGSSIEINNFKYRYDSFVKAIKNKNLELKEEYKYFVEPTMEGAYTDFKKILEDENTKIPKAFFAFNDIIALGALKAMNEKGISIPEDVAIIGFDDIPFSNYSNPPITTVRVETNDMGRFAIKRLIEKIEDEDDSILKVEISTTLIERESVKK